MKTRAFIIGGITAVLLTGGAVAYSAIPDSDDGEIHGCRNNLTGSLRVIDDQAGQNCSPGQTEITWNQTGPQGIPGPAGPQGETGPQGEPGESGLGLPQWSLDTVSVHPLQERLVKSPCNDGETLVSGGGGGLALGSPVVVLSSSPVDNNTAWELRVKNTSTTELVPVDIWRACITNN